MKTEQKRISDYLDVKKTGDGGKMSPAELAAFEAKQAQATTTGDIVQHSSNKRGREENKSALQRTVTNDGKKRKADLDTAIAEQEKNDNANDNNSESTEQVSP